MQVVVTTECTWLFKHNIKIIKNIKYVEDLNSIESETYFMFLKENNKILRC